MVSNQQQVHHDKFQSGRFAVTSHVIDKYWTKLKCTKYHINPDVMVLTSEHFQTSHKFGSPECDFKGADLPRYQLHHKARVKPLARHRTRSIEVQHGGTGGETIISRIA